MALQLTVVTPSGQAFDGEVDQVVLPGAEGEFGVLEQHQRFLSALKPGAMEIHTGGGKQFAALSDGFADVSAEAVTVLVSHCDLASALDAQALQAEVAELEAALAAAGDADHVEIEVRLETARVRLDVAGRA